MIPQPRVLGPDVVRGFAVLGILIMNIIAFGLPSGAYFAPWVMGLESRLDEAVWAVQAWLVDGRMRALFAILFGTGLAMMADRLPPPGMTTVRLHVRRMLALLAIGLVHAWAFWYGDILSYYAVIGLVLGAALRWPARRLIGLGLGLLIFQALIHGISALHGLAVWQAAQGPGATEEARVAWESYRAAVAPDTRAVAELVAYRGTWTEAFAARREMLLEFYAFLFPYAVLFETAGQMLVGMALWRMGWWTKPRTGGQTRRRAARFLTPGLVLLGITTWLYARSGFLVPMWFLSEAVRVLAGTAMALGYAVILLWLAARGGWLIERLAAVGRMALSNYLAQTLIATSLFYGWGLGLFGLLSRSQLLLVWMAISALQLAWSKPWLAAHAHGPVEWLWRWAARGRRPAWRLQGEGAVSGPPVRTNHSS